MKIPHFAGRKFPTPEVHVWDRPKGRTGAASGTGTGRGFPLLGLGLRCAQNAPKSSARLHCVLSQGGLQPVTLATDVDGRRVM
jgi:hypothetical protein